MQITSGGITISIAVQDNLLWQVVIQSEEEGIRSTTKNNLPSFGAAARIGLQYVKTSAELAKARLVAKVIRIDRVIAELEGAKAAFVEIHDQPVDADKTQRF